MEIVKEFILVAKYNLSFDDFWTPIAVVMVKILVEENSYYKSSCDKKYLVIKVKDQINSYLELIVETAMKEIQKNILTRVGFL